MSCFVVVSFDIENETSATYREIETKLNEYGLHDSIIGSSKRRSKLPANTFAGTFKGEGVGKIRDDVAQHIQSIFKEQGVTGRIFVSVGDSWSWGIRTT